MPHSSGAKEEEIAASTANSLTSISVFHLRCFLCLTNPKCLIILSLNSINSFVYLVFLFIRYFCVLLLLLLLLLLLTIYLFMYLLLIMARGKVTKWFPCPGSETYRGSWGVSPPILSVGNRRKWLTSRPGRFISERKHRYLLNKKQCVPQSRFGPFGKEEISLYCRDSKPRSPKP